METIQQIEAIWKKAFKVTAPKHEEAFFNQGGGSLQALLFINEVNECYNSEFNVVDVFEYPSIKLFCEYFEQSGILQKISVETKNKAPELKPVYTTNNLYHTNYSQKAHWFKFKYSTVWLPENSINTFDFDYFDEEAFRKFVLFLLQRHESLNTTYHYINGEVFQKINQPTYNELAIQFVDKRNPDGSSLGLDDLYNSEVTKYIDIEVGPLYSIVLCQLEDNLWRLYLTIEMSITEGTSSLILREEIPLIYKACHINTPLELKPISIQYKDFSEWETELLQSENGLKLKNYWINYFKEKPKPVLLSPDYPYSFRKANRLTYKEALEHELTNYSNPHAIDEIETISGRRSSFKYTPGIMAGFILKGKELKSIGDRAAELNTTRYVLYLTCIYLLFYKLTRKQEITIGNCISLRDNDSLSNSIGFFTNIVFTKITIDPNETIESLVTKVNKHFFDGYQHRNYPWEKILEENDIPFDNASSLFLDYLQIPMKLGIYKLQNHIQRTPCIFNNNCFVFEYTDAIIINWVYSMELFSENTFDNIIAEHENIMIKIFDSNNYSIDQFINYVVIKS